MEVLKSFSASETDLEVLNAPTLLEALLLHSIVVCYGLLQAFHKCNCTMSRCSIEAAAVVNTAGRGYSSSPFRSYEICCDVQQSQQSLHSCRQLVSLHSYCCGRQWRWVPAPMGRTEKCTQHRWNTILRTWTARYYNDRAWRFLFCVLLL